MAKGFGSPKSGHLGYVLLLLPEVKAYAADFSLGEDGEEFIGITNIIEDAQVWKNKSEARQAIVNYYSGLLIELLDEKSKLELSINKLSRLSNGKLKDEPVEKLTFEPVNQED